ncbi:MAG: glucokinase [Burkholderiales bacterium]
MAARYLLAADVGGTRATIALASEGRPWPAVAVQSVYESQRFDSLKAVIETFLARPDVAPHRKGVQAACFSVAGPVAMNSVTLTNLGWKVRGDALAAELGVPEIRLLNDFAAAGLGIPRLAPGELEALQTGHPVAGGTRLILGAGTGLGTGFLTAHGDGYVAHSSEAGHADFAPVDELQDKLLVYLRRVFGRVSYERVVSGPGLMRIFSFLQESGAGVPSKQLQEAARNNADTAGVIGEFGLAKRDPLAARALDIFASAYGAFAGNMALATLARGGVYLAGGIAPKLAGKLKDGTFMRAFTRKGRFAELLSSMPVHIIMNPMVGLLGAAAEAQRMLD